MRFSHLSALPRVRRIAHVVAASSRETSNNNAVQTLDGSRSILDYGAEEEEEDGAASWPTASEVEAFWSMVDAKLRSALRETQQRKGRRESTPGKRRHHLGDELTGVDSNEDAQRRGRGDSSSLTATASVGTRSPSRDSPTRSLAQAQALLRRFEEMTTTHRMALQWRETRAFLGQEGAALVCGHGRDLVHSGV